MIPNGLLIAGLPPNCRLKATFARGWSARAPRRFPSPIKSVEGYANGFRPFNLDEVHLGLLFASARQAISTQLWQGSRPGKGAHQQRQPLNRLLAFISGEKTLDLYEALANMAWGVSPSP